MTTFRANLAESHKRDYITHGAIDAAVHTLVTLQDPAFHNGRLQDSDLALITELSGRLRSRAAQIVRTWD